MENNNCTLYLGNVAFDTVSSRLVVTTDSSNGEASNSHDNLIPYVPYPTNPETGKPTVANFNPLEKKSDMVLNGPMIESKTGQTVPILAMTIHPVTGMLFIQQLFFSNKVNTTSNNSSH